MDHFVIAADKFLGLREEGDAPRRQAIRECEVPIETEFAFFFLSFLPSFPENDMMKTVFGR